MYFLGFTNSLTWLIPLPFNQSIYSHKLISVCLCLKRWSHFFQRAPALWNQTDKNILDAQTSQNIHLKTRHTSALIFCSFHTIQTNSSQISHQFAEYIIVFEKIWELLKFVLWPFSPNILKNKRMWVLGFSWQGELHLSGSKRLTQDRKKKIFHCFFVL